MTKLLMIFLSAMLAMATVAKADNNDALNSPLKKEKFIIKGHDDTNYKAGEIEDEYGTTNPEELTLNSYISNMNGDLKNGKDFVCSLGYLATKSGRHEKALKIFNTCNDHGNEAAKIWMSYMHQNGYGVHKDAAKSTEWVKKSAEAGYSIGMYNYGLALLKGYGVKRDFDAGKALIDEMAAQGDIHAKELVKNNYNPDVVTPDADQEDSKPIY